MFLTTLGDFHLRDEPAGEIVLGPGKPLALLTFLALADQQHHSRDQLASMFWDALPPDRARQSLRQAIHVLRRVIGEERIETRGPLVQIITELSSDYQQFIEAAKGSDASAAISLHGDQFLAGTAIAGASAFDSWAAAVRARLTLLYLGISSRHIDDMLASGRAADALGLARQLRDAHPEQPVWWKAVITVNLHLGNDRAAQLEAEALGHAASSGIVPLDPGTRELLSRLTVQPTTGTRASGPFEGAEMAGRSAEFANLTAAWQEATLSRTTRRHLVGEPGIGKSRLLGSLAGRITVVGGNVVTCRAAAGDRGIPCATLAAWLEELARLPGALAIDPGSATALVRLSPTLRAVFPAVRMTDSTLPNPSLLVSSLVDLIRNLTSERPLALLLDDLHWADPTSLELFGAAITRSHHQQLLIVSASRHTGGLPGMSSAVLPVGPISVDAVRDLLESMATISSDDGLWLARHLHGAGHGNPLMMLDALRSLEIGAHIALHNGNWLIQDRNAVESMLTSGSSMQRRIDQLGVDQRRALNVLAVTMHPATRDLIAACAGTGPGTDAALADLEIAGIARCTGREWEVAHDRYAELAASGIADQELHSLHLRLAGSLLALHPDDGPSLVRALSHAGHGKDQVLIENLGDAWLHSSAPFGGHPKRMLQQFASRAGALHMLPTLLKCVPWYRRTVVQAVIGGIATVGLIAFLSADRNTTSYRLQLRDDPVLDWQTPAPGTSRRFIVPIAVHAMNTAGEPITSPVESIRVRIMTSGATLEGNTVVALDNGTASFDSLRVRTSSDSTITLQLAGDRYGVIANLPLRFAPVDPVALHLLSGSLNGQKVAINDPEVRITSGDSIVGELSLRYSAKWISGVVFLCAVGSWERGAAGTWTLESVRTGVSDGHIVRRVRFPGPSRPGRYHLIFAMRAEPACSWISSQTNWTWGREVWGDGNDLADITETEFREARRTGMLWRTFRQDSLQRTAEYGIQGIRVVVE